MAKFTPRKTAPSRTDKNFINYKYGGYSIAIAIDKNTGYTMPNCVGYAHGRLREILGSKGVNWKIPAGDAETFIAAAKEKGFEVGNTPKLGAVAVWKAGSEYTNKDGAGHVAVVEEIKANGDIVVSNSAYNGDEFYLKTVTKASGYVYAETRPFMGFVYCGIEFDTPSNANVPTTATVKAGMKVTLNNTPCYTSESAKESYGKKSGTFYLWDDVVKSGRIRITNKPERVGVKGQVTCWVAIADIGLKTEGKPASTSTATSTGTTVKAGQKFTLKNVLVYNSESGASIGTRSGIYYPWDNVIKNGRIRMTNHINRVGVKGMVSFWVDVSSLKN